MPRHRANRPKWRRGFIVACACLLGNACDKGPALPPPPSPSADTAWYRNQLVDDNAKPRVQFALAENGFYRPNLGRDWRPIGEQRGTLITQTRAIYVMAAAYEVTGDKVYYDAMVKAADFLLDHMANKTESGRWVREVAPDGKVLVTGYHAYGQTQAIFALAHAYRSSKDRKYLDAALGSWVELDIPGLVAGRRPDVKLLGLNFAMHAFEGMLALYKAEPSKLLFADVRLLGDFIVNRFFEPKRGFFYEDLGADFRPAADSGIRLGHNVEMAFLLSRGVDAGLPETYLEPANRALDFVVAKGFDRASGSLPHELNYDGTVRDATLVWWCQTELLRGLAHFAQHRGRTDLQAAYDASLAYVKAHFIDPEYGGWYERADRPDLGKGHDWFAGYHIAMMLTEVLRLRGATFRSGPEMLL